MTHPLTPLDDLPVLLTPAEIMKYLKISRPTLIRWRKAGMPFRQYDTHIIRYDPAAIERWRQARQRGAV